MIDPAPNVPKCANVNCRNRADEGKFTGKFCAPCFQAILSGLFVSMCACGDAVLDHSFTTGRCRLCGCTSPFGHGMVRAFEPEQVCKREGCFAKFVPAGPFHEYCSPACCAIGRAA